MSRGFPARQLRLRRTTRYYINKFRIDKIVEYLIKIMLLVNNLLKKKLKILVDFIYNIFVFINIFNFSKKKLIKYFEIKKKKNFKEF